jgi:hypothetical protein
MTTVDPVTEWARGKSLIGQGRWTDALQCFQHFVTLDVASGDRASAFMYLMRLAQKLGDNTGAIQSGLPMLACPNRAISACCAERTFRNIQQV